MTGSRYCCELIPLSMMPWLGGRPMSSAAPTPRSKCCCAEPSTTQGECPRRLDLCPSEAGPLSIDRRIEMPGLAAKKGRLTRLRRGSTDQERLSRTDGLGSWRRRWRLGLHRAAAPNGPSLARDRRDHRTDRHARRDLALLTARRYSSVRVTPRTESPVGDCGRQSPVRRATQARGRRNGCGAVGSCR